MLGQAHLQRQLQAERGQEMRPGTLVTKDMAAIVKLVMEAYIVEVPMHMSQPPANLFRSASAKGSWAEIFKLLQGPLLACTGLKSSAT